VENLQHDRKKRFQGERLEPWTCAESMKTTQEAGGKCGFDVLGYSRKEYSIISELPSSEETSLRLLGYNGQKWKFPLLTYLLHGAESFLRS